MAVWFARDDKAPYARRARACLCSSKVRASIAAAGSEKRATKWGAGKRRHPCSSTRLSTHSSTEKAACFSP